MDQKQKNLRLLCLVALLGVTALGPLPFIPQASAQEEELSLDGGLEAQAESAPATNLPAPARAPEPVAASNSGGGNSGGSGDEPNVSLERRLYRMFGKSRPVSPEKWSEMIGSRKEDVYAVQSGDTLWDISKTMFGDGFFWSKLWAENGTLENPHQISKGKGIRFVAGNEDAAPVVDVVSEKAVEMIKINALRESKGAAPTYREEALKELTPEELMNQNAVEVEELIAQPEIPPNMRPHKPVLSNLPGSFVSRKPPEDGRYDISGLDAGRDRSRTTVTSMITESYLLDSAPVNIGKVDEVEVGEKVASLGQNVFLKLTRPAAVGAVFSVAMPKGMVKDPVRGEVGPIMEVGGQVQVISAVDETKNIYRATVITNVNPIQRGSYVSEEPLPRTTFVRRGTRLNVDVRIIGGEYDKERKIIGESAIVYLDGGSKAGISVGDILGIQASRSSRRAGTSYPKWRRAIGLLKIVRAEPTVSTAIVLEAQEEIMTGDRTGGEAPERARTIRDNDPEAFAE